MLGEFLKNNKQVVLCGNVKRSGDKIKEIIKQWGYEELEKKELEVSGEVGDMRAEKFYRICELIGLPFMNATQRAKDFPIVWDVFQLDGQGGIRDYWWNAGCQRFVEFAEKYEDKKFVAIFEGIEIGSVKKILSKMAYMLEHRGERVNVRGNVRGEETKFFIPSNIYFIAVFRDDESRLSEWECRVIEEIGRYEIREL